MYVPDRIYVIHNVIKHKGGLPKEDTKEDYKLNAGAYCDS